MLALDRSIRRGRSYTTSDGFLHLIDNVVTKATVSSYSSAEIPNAEQLGLARDTMYRLLRPASELKRALPTLANVPVLIEHRPTTADDYDPSLVIGTTASDARWHDDDLSVTVSLTLWSQPAIDAALSGERSNWSCGYRYEPQMTPGVFRGMPYDGVMKAIYFQHVGLVNEGRVPGAVVQDAQHPSLRRWR